MQDFSTILAEAFLAAQDAAKAEDARLPPENSRGFDCGFAWVDVPTPHDADPVTKAFVKWCKGRNVQPNDRKYGNPRGYGKAAWQFWSPAKAITQSISVHYAGAAAFALVLRNHGIRDAQAGQRLD